MLTEDNGNGIAKIFTPPDSVNTLKDLPAQLGTVQQVDIVETGTHSHHIYQLVVLNIRAIN